MNDPVPFIRTGDDGASLVVDPKAREVLAKIDKPLVVASVVGSYRTGKSFLLNLLMKRTDGFPLGSTIEAKTKGIWMWAGEFPGDPNRALVLLDTEGLSDPEKGDKTHDTQIFTLAILLSSVLIYNTKGVIDASSLDGLQLATELTKHVSSKATGDGDDETGEDFALFFPTLVWAIRDHHLSVEVDGEVISANQYLEHCLKQKRGQSAAVHQYNGLRRTIRAFFQNRHCFLFPSPCGQESLNSLDHMTLEELDPAFIQAGQTFTDFVSGQGPTKRVRGKAITGSMWLTLAEQYVEAIVTGPINIGNAYDCMIRMENTKSVQTAIQSYKAEMDKLQLPQEIEALNAANSKALAAANKILLNTAVNIQEHREYSDNLNKELENLFSSLLEQNENCSMERCTDMLKALYQGIEDRVALGEFTKPGGHQDYKKEVSLVLTIPIFKLPVSVQVERMEGEYTNKPDKEKGPRALDALFFFKSEKVSSE